MAVTVVVAELWASPLDLQIGALLWVRRGMIGELTLGPGKPSERRRELWAPGSLLFRNLGP